MHRWASSAAMPTYCTSWYCFFSSRRYLAITWVFETARTPATGVGWPAETPVRHQGGIPFCLVFVEILLKGVGRFEPGDGPANIPFQLFQMFVHLRIFEAGVAEQNFIHLTTFLQQTQNHGGRVLPAGERGNGQNRLIPFLCLIVGFKHLLHSESPDARSGLPKVQICNLTKRPQRRFGFEELDECIVGGIGITAAGDALVPIMV